MSDKRNIFASLTLETSEVHNIAASFLAELTKAKNGAGSSISYYLTEIDKPQFRPKALQVMAVGGTTFHSAVFVRNHGQLSQEEVRKSELPNFQTKKTFVDFVLQNLSDKADALCLNFAYELEPYLRDGLPDGLLLSGAKEHQFSGMIDQSVGAVIEEAINQQRGKDISVAVINDTVCLVLAGKEHYRPGTAVAGCVVGTGFNIGFAQSEHTFVSTECADFTEFTTHPYVREVDAASVTPGEAKFEKEISGKYLFQTFNTAVQRSGLQLPLAKSTEELSQFAQEQDGIKSELAAALLERSASMVAAAIYATYQFLGKQHLAMVMEGSLYWSGHNYRNYVRAQLTALGVDPLSISFNRKDQSYLYGALSLFIL